MLEGFVLEVITVRTTVVETLGDVQLEQVHRSRAFGDRHCRRRLTDGCYQCKVAPQLLHALALSREGRSLLFVLRLPSEGVGIQLLYIVKIGLREAW